jgi:hypothetical protein
MSVNDPVSEDFHAIIADMILDGRTPEEVAEIARRSAERFIRELNDARAIRSTQTETVDE